MGSSSFESRKKAAEELEKIGAKALPQIADELRRTEDPEVRWQARRLIRRISGDGIGKKQGLKPAPSDKDAAKQGKRRAPRWRARGTRWFGGSDFRDLFKDFEEQFRRLQQGGGGFDQRLKSSSSSTKINITPDGVEVEIKDGDKAAKRYTAKDMDSLLRKHPELEGRVSGWSSFRRQSRFPGRLFPGHLELPGFKVFPDFWGLPGLGEDFEKRMEEQRRRFEKSFPGGKFDFDWSFDFDAEAEVEVRGKDGKKLGIYLRGGDHRSVASFLGLPTGTGIMIDKVKEDSSAARLKLRAGDFLVKLNGTWIRSAADVAKVLATGNEKLVAEFYRKGVKKKSSISR